MDLLTSALEYASRGWPVIPLHTPAGGRCSCNKADCGSVGKHPRTSKGLSDATTNKDLIKSWWANWPEANIGIVTGKQAGIFVLDIDTRHGGQNSTEIMNRFYQAMPETLSVKTGGGGWHKYFMFPNNQVSNATALLPGLDIRGERGYVVAPPSLHSSGNLYEWENKTSILSHPDWLQNLMTNSSLLSFDSLLKGPVINEGGRDNALTSEAGKIRNLGYEEPELAAILYQINEARCSPPLSPVDIFRIARSIGSKAIKREAQTTNAIADMADAYLRERELETDASLFLRYYNDDIYIYTGTHYKRKSKKELQTDIVNWARANPKLRNKATQKQSQEILQHIEAIGQLNWDKRVPFWIGDDSKSTENFIALENGILDVNSYRRDKKVTLIPHSSTFFSMACLPYNFITGATCPTFDKFLSEALPDKPVRDLVQEWLGYNLIFYNKLARFVIFEGAGADGKSVLCLILELLVGETNVSAVTLAGFNPERTFPLASTVGKLANIVREIGELEKASEGTLKQFISGEMMTIEQKMKPAFNFYPSAKLTFSTNALPRFTDRSDATYRRLLLIPFRNQILDEKKQDKRLIDGDWWKNSGELPGIFNFALDGLVRLLLRGYFDEPELCLNAKRQFKLERNSALAFLEENWKESPNGYIPTNDLYRRYADDANAKGLKPLGHVEFNKEVKRAFPSAKVTDNPKRQSNGTRCRNWVNIKEKDTPAVDATKWDAVNHDKIE